MQSIKQFILNKKIYIITLLVPIIILGSSLIVLSMQKNPDENLDPVLGTKTEKPTTTPTPTLSPTPSLAPTAKPKVATPTKVPASKATPTPTAASTSESSPGYAPTYAGQTVEKDGTIYESYEKDGKLLWKTKQSGPTSTPAPNPTSTPVAAQVTVKAGSDTWTTTLSSGETAFDIVKRAVGDGLTYDTYDCCGAFITGFHGEKAVYPQWWEFFINGTSASVGVSNYNPASGDVLEFVYHE